MQYLTLSPILMLMMKFHLLPQRFQLYLMFLKLALIEIVRMFADMLHIGNDRDRETFDPRVYVY